LKEIMFGCRIQLAQGEPPGRRLKKMIQGNLV